MKLYKETVSIEMFRLLEDLMGKDIFRNFRLVGGTALSLQIGHRKSIDIDLFTDKNDIDFNPEYISIFYLRIIFLKRRTCRDWVFSV